MIVVSLDPESFRAIAPPARNECKLISDISMPLFFKSISSTAVFSAVRRSDGRTWRHPTVGVK